jgi:hypothetical protein
MELSGLRLHSSYIKNKATYKTDRCESNRLV